MITNRNNTLKLRKHSIRTLTPKELNVVHGGDNSSNCGTQTRSGQAQQTDSY